MPKKQQRGERRTNNIRGIARTVFTGTRRITAPNSAAIFSLSDILIKRALGTQEHITEKLTAMGRHRASLFYWIGERNVRPALPISSVIRITERLLAELPDYMKRNKSKMDAQWKDVLEKLNTGIPQEHESMVRYLDETHDANRQIPITLDLIKMAFAIHEDTMAHEMGKRRFAKYAADFETGKNEIIRLHSGNQ
ncbi:MAG TPA: hypothetical protein HA254_00435 [Candidatus Diapherotrites archaeon]|uniref:Uncharacterized protein n=1 Tax=Candidatus Iainarchaeum sp. TaxID=3101447 RepID=A0A7J4IZ89_9ARCH|nr:hypothetical protein [Candidatus Diapherotrites archaeon]